MEKPVRPKKPKPENTPQPLEVLYDFYYPMTRYVGDPRDPDAVVFYHNDDLPANPWDTEEWEEGDDRIAAEEFYDSHSYAGFLTFSQILAFASEKNILPEELEVVTFNDAYCSSARGSIQVNHRRKVSDEDYQSQMQDYQSAKEVAKQRFQARLAQWQLDKEQYKIDKAAYDVYKAQQKLNSLQN